MHDEIAVEIKDLFNLFRKQKRGSKPIIDRKRIPFHRRKTFENLLVDVKFFDRNVPSPKRGKDLGKVALLKIGAHQEKAEGFFLVVFQKGIQCRFEMRNIPAVDRKQQIIYRIGTQ